MMRLISGALTARLLPATLLRMEPPLTAATPVVKMMVIILKMTVNMPKEKRMTMMIMTRRVLITKMMTARTKLAHLR